MSEIMIRSALHAERSSLEALQWRASLANRAAAPPTNDETHAIMATIDSVFTPSPHSSALRNCDERLTPAWTLESSAMAAHQCRPKEQCEYSESARTAQVTALEEAIRWLASRSGLR